MLAGKGAAHLFLSSAAGCSRSVGTELLGDRARDRDSLMHVRCLEGRENRNARRKEFSQRGEKWDPAKV